MGIFLLNTNMESWFPLEYRLFYSLIWSKFPNSNFVRVFFIAKKWMIFKFLLKFFFSSKFQTPNRSNIISECKTFFATDLSYQTDSFHLKIQICFTVSWERLECHLLWLPFRTVKISHTITGDILTFIRIKIVNKPKSVHVPIKIKTILFKTKF